MCGRYSLRKTPHEVRSIFGVTSPLLPPNLETPRPGDGALRYNIAPTQDVLGVLVLDGARTVGWFRWGLVPPGAQNLRVGARLINARGETLFSRSAFAKPARHQRCLIPADGFIEWKAFGKAKRPFHLRRRDGQVFAMAGIWQRWDGAADGHVSSQANAAQRAQRAKAGGPALPDRSPQDPQGEAAQRAQRAKAGGPALPDRSPQDRAPQARAPLFTCAVVTTTANAVVGDIHDRMPVILHPEDYDRWLDPSEDAPDRLRSLLVPLDPREMIAVPIDPWVNDVAHDDPKCLTEVEAPVPPLEQLGFDFSN